MIYTSYFAKLKKIPENIVPIAISGQIPVWYKGYRYKPLAPKYSFFCEWRNNHDNDYYIEHYYNEVLNLLKVQEVVSILNIYSKGKDIVLVCYEKPEDFCHRHIVAKWLNDNGIECREWTENDI